MSSALTAASLSQFTGTAQWYRHALNRHILYTDGAQHVAEAGGAYWLLDEIVLAQRFSGMVARELFQRWTLTVSADQRAVLDCEDGNGTSVYNKEIPFTDFPLPTITFYFENNVICLPAER